MCVHFYLFSSSKLMPSSAIIFISQAIKLVPFLLFFCVMRTSRNSHSKHHHHHHDGKHKRVVYVRVKLLWRKQSAMCLKFQKIFCLVLICDRISIFHITCVVYEGKVRRRMFLWWLFSKACQVDLTFPSRVAMIFEEI